MRDAVKYLVEVKPSARPRGGDPDARYAIWRPCTLPDLELQTAVHVVDYVLPAHLHETYQFDLMESGTRCYTLAGCVQRRVGAGRLAIIHPYESHAVQFLNQDRNTFRTMHVPVKRLVDANAMVHGQREAPVFPFEIDNRETVGLYLKSHRRIECGDPAEAEEILATLLLALVAHCTDPSLIARPAAPVSRDMLCVRDLIESNLARPIALDEIAALAGVSKFYVARQFTEAFGIPPHTFQVRRRLARAREQLARGLAIKCVAVDLGFSDQSHFGRHFLKTFGLSPAEYQRRATSRSRAELLINDPL
jgi:AraC-like DNA-binding protein